jgi:hypothetical protein
MLRYMANDLKVRAGRIGAQRRWGPRRRLNIGDLTPDQRELVLGVIEAQRIANEVMKKAAAVRETPATADPEVRGGSLDSAA